LQSNEKIRGKDRECEGGKLQHKDLVLGTVEVYLCCKELFFMFLKLLSVSIVS